MPKNRKKYIGVFDSGFGGINILRGIVKELPQYSYIYLGDTARAPYGNRSKELIYEFAKQAVDFLFSKNCELIILACNTASSDALRKIQREYLPEYHPGKKVLGVLIPATEVAVLKTKNNKIGVIATTATVNSGAFRRELKKLNSEVSIFSNACPMLVPLVEAGEHKSKATEILLEKYLAPLKRSKIDTIILGCTHYGILEGKIRKIIGREVNIISEARAVPKKLKSYLKKHIEIENQLSHGKSVKFFSTDLTPNFMILGSKFFGKKIKASKISLH